MNDLKLISRDSIRVKAEEKIQNGVVCNSDDMINIVTPTLSFSATADENFRAIERATHVGHSKRLVITADTIKKYGSAWDVPRNIKGEKHELTVRDMIDKGMFLASANTLPENWQTLWDAMRIDISIRKSATDSIRQNFFKIHNLPNSDKIIKINDLFSYFTEFTENNGKGQAVTQGETRFGSEETIEHKLYSAGWTWDLLNELFNKSMDPQKLSDSVLAGYILKRDDMAMSPILNLSYTGGQQTAAAVLSGAGRQELLYLTLQDALDDMALRKDPQTDNEIDPDGSYILANAWDARHIADVVRGLPSTNEKRYSGISEIAGIVSYNTEVMQGRAKSITYTGVTKGKAYLIKPNNLMNIVLKRQLTMEVDMTPDVKTLSREQRAWYFVEALHNTGMTSFIQEITLPAW